MGRDDNANNGVMEWFDECYLKNVLIACEGQPIEIKDFKRELATAKGENYASAMHLVTVEYIPKGQNNSKKISLIVKSRLDSEFMSEIEQEFNVFEREAHVYQNILSSCEKLLSSIGDNTKFGPRALYVDDRVIIMENLKEQGYGIKDVKKGYDFEHCKKVLEKLAKFHACTIILNKLDPDHFKHHHKGNVSEVYTPLHDLYKNALETCIEYIKTVPDLQEYVPKLEKYNKSLIEKVSNIFTKSPGINVLNHGDVWVNNIMFKESPEESNLNVLFVDYQEGFFGSPGIDWNYFMHTSWQIDVYQRHKKDLIEFYHQIFSTTLTRLNYEKPLPTVEDIEKEILLKGDHGLTTVTCMLPILISEHQDLADPGTFLSDTEEAKRDRLIVFSNPKYANLLRIYLKDFVDQGVL